MTATEQHEPETPSRRYDDPVAREQGDTGGTGRPRPAVLRARTEMVGQGGQVPGRRPLGKASARSLLLTILGEFMVPERRPVWASVLIEALAALGVDEPAARQALVRAKTDGWITPTKVGRRTTWTVTHEGAELLRDGSRHVQEFAERDGRWDGRCTLLTVDTSPLDAKRKDELRRRLRWAHFGELPTGLHVAFDPHAETEAAKIIEDLRLAGRATSFRAGIGEIGETGHLVHAAWDLPAIDKGYQEFLTEAAAIDNDVRDPFVAQVRLVHAWRRLPLLDPGLPHELLPPDWSGHQAAELFVHRSAALRPDALEAWRSRIQPHDGEPEPDRTGRPMEN